MKLRTKGAGRGRRRDRGVAEGCDDIECDRHECRDRNEEVAGLQRELDDTTDRLIVACLERNELEKAVRSAADRISELEADLATGRSTRPRPRSVTAAARPLRLVDGTTTTDAGNVYVFGDDDSDGKAFDDFFSAPDPHLDRVRRFLLG